MIKCALLTYFHNSLNLFGFVRPTRCLMSLRLLLSSYRLRVRRGGTAVRSEEWTIVKVREKKHPDFLGGRE